MVKLHSTLRSHSRIGLLLCIALLSFSCRHENGPSSSRRVTFSVDVLSIDRDSTFTDRRDTPSPAYLPAATSDTPADITLEQASMTDLWVFEGTTLLAHQTSSDAHFGTPQVELSYGHHTITFIASPQSDQSFSAGVWSAPKANDAFGYVADIDVSTSTSSESIILMRLTYGLKWQSTDLVPSGTKTLLLSVSPMRESLQSNLVAVDGYERTYTYDVSAYVGRVVGVTVYGLPEHYGVEDNITSTIEFLDASNNILFTHTRTIPVLNNRRTIITGELFNGSASAAVRINSQWLTDYETNL